MYRIVMEKRNKKKKNLHAGESVILDFSIENSNYFFFFYLIAVTLTHCHSLEPYPKQSKSAL